MNKSLIALGIGLLAIPFAKPAFAWDVDQTAAGTQKCISMAEAAVEVKQLTSTCKAPQLTVWFNICSDEKLVSQPGTMTITTTDKTLSSQICVDQWGTPFKTASNAPTKHVKLKK